MSSEEQLLQEILAYDTPSVTNVVATYPGKDSCLDLYHPWKANWYTDQSIKCMFPDLGVRAGYAVTCIYGLPDADFPGISFMNVIDALEASPKPTVLVLQQNFPEEIRGKVGLMGGNMTTAMKAVGCVGAVSDGPSRDLDEVRDLGFQYMLTGATAGHGPMSVHALNVPVSVAGMDVSPGEIIHMDTNGACKFPAQYLQQVANNLKALIAEEEERITLLRKASTAAEVRSIFAGNQYGDKK